MYLPPPPLLPSVPFPPGRLEQTLQRLQGGTTPLFNSCASPRARTPLNTTTRTYEYTCSFPLSPSPPPPSPPSAHYPCDRSSWSTTYGEFYRHPFPRSVYFPSHSLRTILCPCTHITALPSLPALPALHTKATASPARSSVTISPPLRRGSS